MYSPSTNSFAHCEVRTESSFAHCELFATNNNVFARKDSLDGALSRLYQDAISCIEDLPNGISIEPVPFNSHPEKKKKERVISNPFLWKIRMKQEKDLSFELLFPTCYPTLPPAVRFEVMNGYRFLFQHETDWNASIKLQDVLVSVHSRLVNSGSACLLDFRKIPDHLQVYYNSNSFTLNPSSSYPSSSSTLLSPLPLPIDNQKDDSSLLLPIDNQINPSSSQCEYGWIPWRSGMVKYNQIQKVECFLCKASHNGNNTNNSGENNNNNTISEPASCEPASCESTSCESTSCASCELASSPTLMMDSNPLLLKTTKNIYPEKNEKTLEFPEDDDKLEDKDKVVQYEELHENKWVWKSDIQCVSCKTLMIERYDTYKRLMRERELEWLQMKRIMTESCGLCQVCGIANIKYFFVVIVASKVRGVCDNKRCLGRQRSVFDVISLDAAINEQAEMISLDTTGKKHIQEKQQKSEPYERLQQNLDRFLLTHLVDLNEVCALAKRLRRVRRSKINLSEIASLDKDRLPPLNTKIPPFISICSKNSSQLNLQPTSDLDFFFRPVPRKSGVVRCYLVVKQHAIFNRYELYLDDGYYDPQWIAGAHRRHSTRDKHHDDYSGAYGTEILRLRSSEIRRVSIQAFYTFILCSEKKGYSNLPQFLWSQVLQYALVVPSPGRLLLVAEEGIKKIVISTGEKQMANGQLEKSRKIGTLEFKHFLGQAQPNLKRGTMKSILYQGIEPRGCNVFPCDETNNSIRDFIPRREIASIWWTWNRLALPGARPNEGEICIPAEQPNEWCSSSQIKNKLANHLNASSETAYSFFANSSIPPYCNTETAHSSRNFNGMIPLVTRQPVWDSALRGYVMTFQPPGRVTKASEGNFQLVSPVAMRNGDQTSQDSILLQCGRYGAIDNRWHVDFQYPLSIYQAFSICISNHGISDV